MVQAKLYNNKYGNYIMINIKTIISLVSYGTSENKLYFLISVLLINIKTIVSLVP
jgi:hypothetical protein